MGTFFRRKDEEENYQKEEVEPHQSQRSEENQMGDWVC